MRTIYVDAGYKCHAENDGTMIAIETDFFDGKCQTFIEGYRFIPAGESWTREDGVTFAGEMIAPWKDCDILVAAQAEHEKSRAELEDMKAALALLGVTLGE